jgi:hypothetical protein
VQDDGGVDEFGVEDNTEKQNVSESWTSTLATPAGPAEPAGGDLR